MLQSVYQCCISLLRVRTSLVARHWTSGNLDQYSSLIQWQQFEGGPDKNWRLLSKETVTVLMVLPGHTCATCAPTTAHHARSPPGLHLRGFLLIYVVGPRQRVEPSFATTVLNRWIHSLH